MSLSGHHVTLRDLIYKMAASSAILILPSMYSASGDCDGVMRKNQSNSVVEDGEIRRDYQV